jgi:phospholipid/cholesterol/gamma-HCH transport system permease protein
MVFPVAPAAVSARDSLPHGMSLSYSRLVLIAPGMSMLAVAKDVGSLAHRRCALASARCRVMSKAKVAAASPACLVQVDAQHVAVSGAWTAMHLDAVQASVEALASSAEATLVVDARGLSALDSAGAWLLHSVLARRAISQGDAVVAPEGMSARQSELLARVAQRRQKTVGSARHDVPEPSEKPLQAIGRASHEAGREAAAVLTLLGELAVTFGSALLSPNRWRWRQVLFNVQTCGVDALPIVGLLAFLLGIVVAYQSADQLQQFGANIFIVDVVGLSMLREFAPMMTAIIVAGRSGSAFAAQIGTMAVTEEIDAMHTLGLDPLEMLVLPKLIALVIALPLLTFFADVMGVLGGMLMAHWVLGSRSSAIVSPRPSP